jgi:C1A family cysteine protease
MKKIVLVGLVMLSLFIVMNQKYRENLETLHSAYTHPNHNETLRNPNQLPGSYFRPSNTFLVASHNIDYAIDKLTLPKEVNDQFTEWIDKGFLPVSKDQMACGGCWAFSTCGTIAARLTIATNGKWDAPFGLSDQYMISCANVRESQGCQGGVPQYAIDAMAADGIPKDTLDLSSAVKHTYFQTVKDENSSCAIAAASTCPCDAVKNRIVNNDSNNDDNTVSAVVSPSSFKTAEDKNKKYTTVGSAHAYTTHGPNNEVKGVDFWPKLDQDTINANVERMKKALYFEGPFTVGISVTDDFYKFVPNVDNYFRYDGRSQQLGGHAVTVVGWKKIGDVPVWICKNSWGDNWGYGFPAGVHWKNPITGLDEIKYKGGFWNHVMGVNDQFIESNAVGGYPNLVDPDIAQYLPDNGSKIPKEWYKTMTLRDIMEHHNAPDVAPDETKKKSDISFDKKSLSVTATAIDKTVQQDIANFFNSLTARYLIGGTRSTFESIVKYLPDASTEINAITMSSIITDIQKHVKEYIVLGIKGSNGVFYWILGDSSEWSPFNINNFIGRTVSVQILSNILFSQITALKNMNVDSTNIYFASSKSVESFEMSYCPISKRQNCNLGCCNGQYVNYYYTPKIGMACPNAQSCNQPTMNRGLWSQSIQSYGNLYPPFGSDNKIYTGDIFNLPTAYGAFLPYTPQEWETGQRQKLESAEWRWNYGRYLQHNMNLYH